MTAALDTNCRSPPSTGSITSRSRPTIWRRRENSTSTSSACANSRGPISAIPAPGSAAPQPGGLAIIHVYAGGPALGPEGKAPAGTAAIDHVSLSCSGYRSYVSRFKAAGLDWREFIVPGHLALAIVRLRPERRAARTDVRIRRRRRGEAGHVAGPQIRRGLELLRQGDLSQARLTRWLTAIARCGRSRRASFRRPTRTACRRASVIDATLARIRDVNPKLNAIVTLDEAGAIRAADDSARRWKDGSPRKSARRRAGHDQGQHPGRRACAPPGAAGSTATIVPDEDELPVRRLREAGAVILGKTNVPEFTRARLYRQCRVRHHRQSLGPGADAGRIERRRGRGGCVRHGRARARHRWRRLDPAPRRAYRPDRVQAVARHGAAWQRLSRDPARF